MEEKFISVPEQGGGSLIPDGPLNPGVMHTVATGGGGHLGLYRLETQVTSGNGTLKTSGLGSNSAAKEAIKVGFDYFKANASRVSASIKPGDHDYHLHVVELHNTGPTTAMTLAAFVALCSAVLGKPLQPQMVVLGSMSLGGNIVPVENLAESLAGRLRRRGQAHPAADGEREGHPDDPRRVVRQVPDRLLRRPHGRRVQGAGGAVGRNLRPAQPVRRSRPVESVRAEPPRRGRAAGPPGTGVARRPAAAQAGRGGRRTTQAARCRAPGPRAAPDRHQGGLKGRKAAESHHTRPVKEVSKGAKAVSHTNRWTFETFGTWVGKVFRDRAPKDRDGGYHAMMHAMVRAHRVHYMLSWPRETGSVSSTPLKNRLPSFLRSSRYPCSSGY